jgi:hypothetical protein
MFLFLDNERERPAMNIKICAIAFGLCGCLLSVASAQNPKPNPKLPNLPTGGQNGGGVQVPPGQFGQMPPNQAAANQAAVREAMMKRFDLDRDGRLNAQEQLAATKAMQERGFRVPGAPNLVGPGNNNGPQTGPGQAQPQQQPAAPKLSRREEILLKRFDKDGDGKLNDEEKAAARTELGQKNKAEKK